MKVCILTTSFPRHPGDYAGNFILGLARLLVRNEIGVQVIAPYEPGTAKRERLSDNIDVDRFAYTWPHRWQRVAYLGGIPSNMRRYPLTWLQLPLFVLFFFIRSYRSAKRCDVIHAYWIIAGFVGVILARVLHKPFVVTLQGSDINIMWRNPLLRVFRRFVLERADVVIAVSQELAERVRALCDEGAVNVTVIPNGVDTSVFENCHSAAEPFAQRLLWTGRMSKEKGLVNLLDAMPAVLETHPEACLTLLGDGPMRSVVEERIRALGIGRSVQLPGRVSHEQVVPYLCEADILVFPSLNEGLPLSVLEAMSVGLPVIASSVGGIPDAVKSEGEGQNGMLVPPGDPEALAGAINYLLGHPDKVRQFGQAGQALIRERYSWSYIAAETMKLYAAIRPATD